MTVPRSRSMLGLPWFLVLDSYSCFFFVLRPADPNIEILIAANLENEDASVSYSPAHKNALNTKKTKESLSFDT